MKIRTEQPGDEISIYELTKVAFEPMPYSDGTEPDIIDRLRQDGDLTLSLVASDGGLIVGHVAFSPVKINGEASGWFGLGPISVFPELQRQGIGSMLVKKGLGSLREANAKGCALIGDPKYYSRFGFKSDGNLTYRDTPTQYVQWLAFGDENASGALEFSPAFGD